MKKAVLITGFLVALIQPLAGQRIKLSASLADLEKAARKDSNDAAAHYNVALAYWNEKRWDDADSALHRAVRLDPRFAAAYMALSALPYARRSQLSREVDEDRIPTEWRVRVEEADHNFRQGMLIDPLVELRIGSVLQESVGPYLDAMELLFGEWFRDYQDGQEQYYQGKYQMAYDRLQRVYFEIDADRHANRLWNTLLYWHGLAAAHVQRDSEAAADFAAILERYEDAEEHAKDSTLHVPLRTNEFRYVLAIMKERSGQFNPAIDLYRQALQDDIGLYMAHVRLAQIYESHNMLPQAVTERRAAVNANPDDASLLLDLGQTLARAGQWTEAEQTLRDAITANPRDARTEYFLGIVEQHQNKTAEARAAFTAFVALAPSRYAPQVADAKQRLSSLQ